jgi:type I restriction enzyme S subunit
MMFYKETNFKETPIGKVPKDWEVTKLSNLIELETGKRAKGGALEKGNVASIGGEQIDDEGNILWEKMKFIPEDFYDSLKQGKVKLGDVLLVKDGATTGKVAIVKNLKYEKVAVNEHVVIIRSKARQLINEFLFYFLFSEFGQVQIKTRFHGLIGGIKKSDLETILMPLPPLIEQQRIAEILSTVDEAIQKTNEIIAKTERLKKGLMQELLTKGIGHKEFKDTEIGRIPKDWEVVKLERIFSFKNGQRPKLLEAGKIPVYGANGIMGYTDEFLVDNDFTIVVGRVGASGEVHLGQGKIWISDNAIYSESYEKSMVYPPFVYYLLKFKGLSRFASKTTHPIITQTFLNNFQIQLPSILEQQKIAEILSTVDKKLEIERNEKAKLERIKRGLMDLLLTGKIRVKVNSNG